MKKLTALALIAMLLLTACAAPEAENPLSVQWLESGMSIQTTTLASAVGLSEAVELIPVTVSKNGAQLAGYMDLSGEIVIEPRYASAYPFEGGLARVTVKDENGKTLYGLINNKGETIVEPRYCEMGTFHEGLAVVAVEDELWGKMYGYINTDGKEIIEPWYSYAEPFADGYATVSDYGDLYGVIDREGNEVLPSQYVTIRAFSEGLFPVQRWDGMWGYVDATNTLIIDFAYTDAYEFSEGLAAVQVEVKNAKPRYGYINTEGEWVYEPQFACAGAFSGGYADVGIYSASENSRSVGLINAAGRFVVDPNYSYVNSVRNGIALIHNLYNSGTSQWGWYSVETGTLVAPKYASLSDFTHGLACASTVNSSGETKFGYVLSDGKVVVSMQYDAATAYKDGVAVVGMKNDAGKLKYGCLDTAGAVSLPLEYDFILVLGNIVVVKQGNRSGFVVNPDYGKELSYSGPMPWPLSGRDTFHAALTIAMIVGYVFVIRRDIRMKKLRIAKALAQEQAAQAETEQNNNE